MPPVGSRKKRSATSRKTASRKSSSSSSSSSSSGGYSGNVKHLAEALKLLAERVVFVSEGDRIAFQDHLTAATGGENKDQLSAANERIKAREEAAKTE